MTFGGLLRNRWVLWVVAGSCLGAAFVFSWLWWLALVGLGAFLIATLKARSYGEVVLGGALAGSLHMAIVFSWFWTIYPLANFVQSPSLAFVFIFFGWATAFIATGASKIPLALLLYALANRRPLYAFIAFPFLWAVSEVLGSFLFSAAVIGPGGTLNIDSGFGYVGYLLAEHALLLPLASLGGVYLLSIVYAGAASSAVALWRSAVEKRTAVLVTSVVMFVATAYVPLAANTSPQQNAAIAIGTHLPLVHTTAERQEEERLLKKNVEKALVQGYTYIVLPEEANFRRLFTSDEELFDFLVAHKTSERAVLVDSSRALAPQSKGYVRARIYDTHTRAVHVVDKQYLVPGGEFIPSFFATTLQLFGQEAHAQLLSGKINLLPGPNSDTASQPTDIPGVLFCFDSVSPLSLYRLSRTREMPFVAHVVSHSWFNNPTVLWNELDQMLRVNARFAGIGVVQAANMYKSLQY